MVKLHWGWWWHFVCRVWFCSFPLSSLARPNWLKASQLLVTFHRLKAALQEEESRFGQLDLNPQNHQTETWMVSLQKSCQTCSTSNWIFNIHHARTITYNTITICFGCVNFRNTLEITVKLSAFTIWSSWVVPIWIPPWNVTGQSRCNLFWAPEGPSCLCSLTEKRWFRKIGVFCFVLKDLMDPLDDVFWNGAWKEHFDLSQDILKLRYQSQSMSKICFKTHYVCKYVFNF